MPSRNETPPCPAFRIGLLLLGLVTAGAAAQDSGTKRQPAPREHAPAPERLTLRGIENPFRLSPRLYSGGEPRGEEAFAALKALGVKTVVSVDGATPDVETAHKFGLRYVHVPVGYDGVPRGQAVKIVKAVTTLPGPVFVHCHHGKHRGPTAAAVCGVAAEGWTNAQAVRWLELAGAAPDYAGLYASARTFVPPTAAELKQAGNAFPERVEVSTLVEMMVQVDGRWDQLKAAQKAGFKAPAGQPNMDPLHEALQLVELFRELVRLPESKERGSAFLAAGGEAETRATALESALKTFRQTPTPAARNGLEAAFLAAGKTCTGCHSRFRDVK